MSLVLIAADLAAIAVLIALFLSRHHRRDLVVAYLGVNVGVLAVAAALSTMTASVGLGLGLFGVLSIIRLRSEELNQTEVAHYFAALALGLIGGIMLAELRRTIVSSLAVIGVGLAGAVVLFALGLIGGIGVGMPALAMALMALVLVAVYVGDHPMVSRRTVRQDLLVDRAIVDRATLRAHVELLLGHEVTDVTVRRTDLVNDTTLVTVTSRADAATRATIAQTARVGS